jgi:hypothetical protein
MHVTVRSTVSPGLALQDKHPFIFTIIFYDDVFGRNRVGQKESETDGCSTIKHVDFLF